MVNSYVHKIPDFQLLSMAVARDLQPSMSATEASVFVGWNDSPVIFVGKYLYSKPNDKDTSSIVVKTEDGQQQKDVLEPLHLMIKLKIPSKELPALLQPFTGEVRLSAH